MVRVKLNDDGKPCLDLGKGWPLNRNELEGKNYMNCKQSFSKAVSLVPRSFLNYSKRSKTGVGEGLGNVPSGYFSYLNTSVVLSRLFTLITIGPVLIARI